MHFKRLGFLDNLRALAPGTVSMSDFQVAAPSPAVPRSWADLSSATRTFVGYCREMCDSTTVRVAEALDAFILSLEGWRQLEDDELPLLVLWIDSALERYRGCVVRDLHAGTSTRTSAASWFSTTNPEVQTLLFAILGERTRQGQPSEIAGVKKERVQSLARSHLRCESDRKIPKDVVEVIPTRNGKEECLHYLSIRGCNPQNPEHCTYQNRLHFLPERLAPKLHQYIVSRLGGLSKKLGKSSVKA
ncbi:hypothetical protein DVH05_000400 [Phytophthora capsici]|nr:hypothetical protein DVH05_000400 [Phytophthora capsici]